MNKSPYIHGTCAGEHYPGEFSRVPPRTQEEDEELRKANARYYASVRDEEDE